MQDVGLDSREVPETPARATVARLSSRLLVRELALSQGLLRKISSNLLGLVERGTVFATGSGDLSNKAVAAGGMGTQLEKFSTF